LEARLAEIADSESSDESDRPNSDEDQQKT
jgi:hypothetical protein